MNVMQEVKLTMTLPSRRKKALTLAETEEHSTPDETDTQSKRRYIDWRARRL